MRTIKFRAWDEVKSTMVMQDSCFPFTLLTQHGLYLLDPTREENFYKKIDRPHSLMQFTGFVDKGWKEIYEGDIVKYYTSVRETHVVAVVTFEQQAGAYWVKWNEEVDGKTIHRYKEFLTTFSDGETFECDIYEVIGNIYETPELLK